MAETHQGRCFCGAVEFEATGAPLEVGYCHCNSCRAYSGGPISGYFLWKSADVKVTRGAEVLGGFNKTGMTERQFCTKCGSHLMSYHPAMGVTDVRPGAVPSLVFTPTMHLNYADTILPMKDGLPKLRDFPAEAGGSGETMPD